MVLDLRVSLRALGYEVVQRNVGLICVNLTEIGEERDV